MKVLLTGGAGFVGTNLAERLASWTELVGVDLRKPIELVQGTTFIKGDLLDRKFLEVLFKDFGPFDVLLHIAAQARVDPSLTDPIGTYRTNVESTINLLEKAKLGTYKDRIPTRFIYASCYDELTRAVTHDGLKSHDELRVGEPVLSVDERGELEWVPIKQVIIQDYNGPMFHWKGKRVDLMVTPNHRVFMQDAAKRYKFEEAATASKRSYFYAPKGVWVADVESNFFLPKPEQHWNSNHGPESMTLTDFMYLLGLYIGDGVASKRVVKKHSKTGMRASEYVKIHDSAGRFVQLQESRKGQLETTEMHVHKVVYHIPSSDKSRVRLENILISYGIETHQFKQYGVDRGLVFSCEPLWYVLKEAGQHAKEKHIPEWIWKYDRVALSWLLSGMLDSDGHKQSNPKHGYHSSLTTVSERLAYDCVRLATYLGMTAVVTPYHSLSKFGDRNVESRGYRVYITAETQPRLFREMCSRVQYSGKVWCVNLSRNHNFLVERNGRFIFSGNSEAIYGNADRYPTKENDHFRPVNPYASSKISGDVLTQQMNGRGLSTVVVRSGMGFGERSPPNQVITKMILRCMDGRPLAFPKESLFSKIKHPTRDVNYIQNFVAGITQILDHPEVNGVYNMASGREVDMVTLAKLIIKTVGKGEIVRDPNFHYREGELGMRTWLDISKARKAFGYDPKVTLEEGLKLTYEWLKNGGRELYSW